MTTGDAHHEIDQRAARCYDCGYDLVGLGADAPCPECGGQRRMRFTIGTPWQQDPRIGTYIRTAWILLNNPGQIIHDMHTEPRPPKWASILAAAIIMACTPVAPLIFAYGLTGVALTTSVLSLTGFWIAALAVWTLLIDAALARFTRLHRDQRATITAHAATLVPIFTCIAPCSAALAFLIEPGFAFTFGMLTAWAAFPAIAAAQLYVICISARHNAAATTPVSSPAPSSTPCQSCGYNLNGLSTDAHCPECGLPVAASDYDARPGTPWQRRRDLKHLLVTTWRIIIRPRVTFADMRFTPRPSQMIAILAAWLFPSLVLILLGVLGAIDNLASILIISSIFWFAGATIGQHLIDAICRIVTRVQQDVSNERRRAVCSHASLIIPAMMLVACVAMLIIVAAANPATRFTQAFWLALRTMWISLPVALIAYAAMIRTGLRHSRPTQTGDGE